MHEVLVPRIEYDSCGYRQGDFLGVIVKGTELFRSEGDLILALIVGVGLGVGLGWFTFPYLFPLFQNTGLAAWVQAIGAIAAIYYSTRIGKKQAENALEIHIRDVEQRNKELSDKNEKQEKVREIRDREMRESALAEASFHCSALELIELDLGKLSDQFGLSSQKIHGWNKNIKNLRDEYNSNQFGVSHHRFQQMASELVLKINREEDSIKDLIPRLESYIAELSSIPRSLMRYGDVALADYISFAINGLQRAILGIKHFKEHREVAFSIFTAEKNIGNFLKKLDILLVDREDSVSTIPTSFVFK